MLKHTRKRLYIKTAMTDIPIAVYIGYFIWNSYARNKISNCAVITRKNIVNGYTVEYATAGASLLAVLLA